MAPNRLLDRHSQQSVSPLLLVVAVLLVAARIAFEVVPEPARREGVRWLTPEQAMTDASGKPFFYDFTAEWCAPCHRLDEEVFADRQIAAEINERFVPVRVVDRMQEDGRNTPAVADLQQRYRVTAFPTIVIADGSGILARMEGFGGRDHFERTMQQVR